MSIKYKNLEYRKGDVIKASIKGVDIISVVNIETDGMFLCHNKLEFNGRQCSDKLHMPYSLHVFSYKKNSLIDHVTLGSIIGRYKKNYHLDNDILEIFVNNNIECYLFVDSIYKDYDKFNISKTRGMISLSNTKNKKSTNIKFGRFLTLYNKEISEKFNTKLLTPKKIEELHNQYLLYQSKEHITVEEISGNKIYDAYDSKNFSESIYTLGSSCMNNKDADILSLYMNNPKSVKLLVVKKLGKIAGRCLIWTTDCGKTIMDKRYICGDWVNMKFDEIKNNKNMINYFDIDKNYKVTVNVEGISKYPYLDTFSYLTDERLFSFGPSFIKKLHKKMLNPAKKKVLSIEKPRKETMRLKATDGLYF